jgi:hypothetical protein
METNERVIGFGWVVDPDSSDEGQNSPFVVLAQVRIVARGEKIVREPTGKTRQTLKSKKDK